MKNPRKYILATCLVAACFAAPVTGKGQSAFSDDFENPAYTAANWTIESGSWRVKGGTYNQDAPREPYNFSSVFTQNYTNFTLDCDISNLGNGGLIVREDPKAMTGLMLMASINTGQIYFVLRKGTAVGDILSKSLLNVSPGGSFHLILTAQGNQFTGTAVLPNDRNKVLGQVTLDNSYRTEDLTTGRVGVFELGNSSDYMNFDNFAVAVPEPGTWAICLAGLAGLAAAKRVCRRTPARRS